MDDPRVFITLFGRPIYWYGLLFAGGFLLAVIHWAWLGKRTRRRAGLGSDLGLWTMIGGVIGARLLYVVQFWTSQFADDPLSIFRIDQGGLVFYGGFLGGIVTILIFARLHRSTAWQLHGSTWRENTWSLGDFVTTALPLGHASGRLGCFLHGCCHGKPTDSWFSYTRRLFDESGELIGTQVCYPTQLTEVVGLLLIYGILLVFYLRNRVDGRVFALYLMLYALLRFGNEFLRGDKGDFTTWGLTDAQFLSIAALLAGGVTWVLLGRRNPRQTA